MTTYDILPPYKLYSVHYSDTKVTDKIRVDISSNTPSRTMRVVVPVAAGDYLEITAEDRITNNTGYNMGIGMKLWWYDVDDGVPWPHTVPWTQINPPTGDNVPPARHHMPITINRVYRIPSDWPVDHRIVINTMVDAHSVAGRDVGEYIKVDSYGALIVKRWTIDGV